MASSILRSIYRCTSSSRSNSPNFLGSPINCRSLSSAAAGPPWLMLPPTYEESGNRFLKYLGMGGKVSHNFYNLADNKVMSVRKRSTIGMNILNLHLERLAALVGSSHGWLAYYRAHSNLDLFLYNPLSHRHVKLPSVELLNN